MIERTSITEKELSLCAIPSKIRVDTWICPMCKQPQVSVYLDDMIEVGGEFYRGDGLAGCIPCWGESLTIPYVHKEVTNG